jgi:hypothetical protein
MIEKKNLNIAVQDILKKNLNNKKNKEIMNIAVYI